jgi:hypothetical protein
MNRKNLWHITLFLLVATLFFGCAKKEKTAIQEQTQMQLTVPKEEVIEIQLSNSHDYKHKFKLSEIAEEVSYIPLETNEKCLIGGQFSQPVFTEEYIFIESGGVVFQFDRQGKFSRKINSVGQGPSECGARDFVANEKKKLIYIFDNWNLSVYIFDFSGKHIKTIKNPFKEKDGLSPSRIGCDKEGNIFYYFGNSRGNMKYKYVVLNNEGEFLNESPNYTTYNIGKRIMEMSMPSYPIYEVGDICYYFDNFNDTIFQINKDYTTSVAYIVKIPNRLSLEDNLRSGAGDIEYSSLSNKNSFCGVEADERYLYIYHAYNPYGGENRKSFFSLYNKQTKQLTENINTNIKNDWDNGEDILMDPYYQDEDEIYTMLQPFKMKEMLADATKRKEAKFPEKQAALKELVDNMEEDDNPFIMIVKLK